MFLYRVFIDPQKIDLITYAYIPDLFYENRCVQQKYFFVI